MAAFLRSESESPSQIYAIISHSQSVNTLTVYTFYVNIYRYLLYVFCTTKAHSKPIVQPHLHETKEAHAMTALIRVLKTVRSGNNQPEPNTLWRGTDVTELSKLYPPSDIMFADPLGHSEIEGGHIRTDYTFQRLVADEWITIPDPRVRLNRTMTATERAIDAENRRLFPGDFGEADDEQYDPYGTEGSPWYEEPIDEPVLCRVCDDQGCELCDPNWFDEDDEPEPPNGYCIDCKSKEATTPGGICAECEAFWANREEDMPLPDNICPNCEMDPAVEPGKLCADCMNFHCPVNPLKRAFRHVVSLLHRALRH